MHVYVYVSMCASSFKSSLFRGRNPPGGTHGLSCLLPGPLIYLDRAVILVREPLTVFHLGSMKMRRGHVGGGRSSSFTFYLNFYGDGLINAKRYSDSNDFLL